MSSLPRIGYPGRQAWVGLMITGVMFLIAGFAIWLMLLGITVLLSFFEASSHMPQARLHPPQSIVFGWCLKIGYCGAFFLAGFGVARSRWSCRPGLAALIAYAAFLTVYLPCLDWTRGLSFDFFGLFLPLVTAPLGGFLGERFFAKG